MWNSSKSQKNHATGIASDSPQGSSSNGVVPLKNIIEKQGKDGESPINDGFRFVIGVPHNHPFLDGIFPEINHPAIGVPPIYGQPSIPPVKSQVVVQSQLLARGADISP